MHLKPLTLKYRRLRGNMIEVFKITHNIYDPEVSPELRYYLKYKLLNHTFHYDTRKYSFSAHIVNIGIAGLGIACLILLLMLILFVCLKHV